MTGRIFREIIPPLLTLYLFFLVMLVAYVRRRPRRPPEGEERRWGPPLRYTAVTVTAGYLFFLGIVFVFMDLATGDRTAMRDAFMGGSALLFGIVVPAFLLLSAAEGWVDRRRRRR